MHVHTRLMFFLLAFSAIGGCATADSRKLHENYAKCRVGAECQAIGRLFIYRGVPASVAELKTATGCLALALPDDQYERLRKSQGQTFRVSGRAFEQSRAEGVTSYQLEDRWVATGICASGLVLYVSEIARTK